MRRKILLIVLCVIGILYLQFGRPIVVNNMVTSGNPTGYQANLTVTVNKIHIFDREKLAKDLIQKTIDNDFKNILLSYDVLGYPGELTITVYTNRLEKYMNTPALKIRFYQEVPYLYNIKDNPEMFSLIYE